MHELYEIIHQRAVALPAPLQHIYAHIELPKLEHGSFS